jgi:hypothetical protein
VQAGARLQASALASHLLRYQPPAGSVESAYVLRLAKAVGDPSAKKRAADLAAWNQDAETDWPKILPLRFAALEAALGNGNKTTGWESLRKHWLYGYRARFELALAR